ncbi:hypothetical protein ACFL20_02945 [Spirochaetota bacterium]
MDYWKDFYEKTEINNGLYWSAEFHSLNERYDDLYYVVTVYKKDIHEYIPRKRFGVVVDVPLHGKNADEKHDVIFTDLSNRARKGKTNIPKDVLWKGIGQDNIDKL